MNLEGNDMKIDFNYSSINISIDLSDKICVFYDMSGTGKTFLFDILKSYFLVTKTSYISIDYSNYEVLNNYDFSDDTKIIMLDNADLYMTGDMFSKLEKSNKLVIMSIKSIKGLNQRYMGFYNVIYTEDKIRVMRYGV